MRWLAPLVLLAVGCVEPAWDGDPATCQGIVVYDACIVQDARDPPMSQLDAAAWRAAFDASARLWSVDPTIAAGWLVVVSRFEMSQGLPGRARNVVGTTEPDQRRITLMEVPALRDGTLCPEWWLPHELGHVVGVDDHSDPRYFSANNDQYSILGGVDGCHY